MKTTDPDWPVGKVATRIIIFTRKSTGSLIRLVKMFHESVEVVNPDEKPEIAEKFLVRTLPTIIFLWEDIEISRMEFIEGEIG